MQIYKPPKVRRTIYGPPVVPLASPDTFKHLIGMNVDEIIPFDIGTDLDLEQGRTVLPRHYFIFIGNKDNEMQFKPYEYNPHRIVVTTYDNIIVQIESIG